MLVVQRNVKRKKKNHELLHKSTQCAGRADFSREEVFTATDGNKTCRATTVVYYCTEKEVRKHKKLSMVA